MSGCLKGCLVALAVLVVIGLIGGFFVYRYISQLAKTPTAITKNTTITIESGSATNSTGPLTSGQTVSSGDTITTAPNSLAFISFPNGSQLRLDENTTITITSSSPNISIFQELGRTWSRVTKLVGGNETYEVETASAVATVRGTAFATTVTTDGSSVDTDEGQVELAAIEGRGKNRKILQKILIDAGHTSQVRKRDLEDLRQNRKQLVKEVITKNIQDGSWFKTNRIKDRLIPSRILNTQNPLSALSVLQSLSPADIQKLRSLPDKMKSLSPEQSAQIEQIASRYKDAQDASQINPADLAEILKIVDPENFSDTNHWTSLLSTFLQFANSSQNQELLKDIIPSL